MYQEEKQQFTATFGRAATHVFSAPGRTEIGGNHTDHQRGRVLAAAVNLETVAAVARNDRGEIRVQSQGYPMCTVSLDDLALKQEEEGTTTALVRGVAGRLQELGYPPVGFDAYVTSTVLPGSGLSSSAAFEVLMGTILNHFTGAGLTPAAIAQVGQYAENVYFGKPCGLMDQMASAVGNVMSIDFQNPEQPQVEQVALDLEACGYALCILDSGADHADLTDEYAAIPRELEQVCTLFGAEVLREVPEEKFYQHLNAVRRFVGDRAMLRAIHVYEENKRVERQLNALRAGDFPAFLEEIRGSGRSSWMYLQNIVPAGETRHQELAFVLALAEHLLGSRGACRVHGGGFAGTIQAFVPLDELNTFRTQMEQVLGAGSCHVLSIRPQGGILVETIAQDEK